MGMAVDDERDREINRADLEEKARAQLERAKVNLCKKNLFSFFLCLTVASLILIIMISTIYRNFFLV